MIVRELLTKWSIKADDTALKNLETGISNVKQSLFIVGAAGIAAAAALFGVAQATATLGDDARKTAQALGLTTETLQELQFAASIGGLKAAEVTTAIRKLAKTANDANMGMETYARAFREIGVSVTDSSGKLKDADILISEIADKVALMPAGMKKTALMTELFGRAGARLIPMLNSGSKGIAELRKEAVLLGGVMSDEDAKAAEEFNDSIGRLLWVLRGFKIAIGKELIPMITGGNKSLKEWFLTNQKIIKQKMDRVVKNLVVFLKGLYGITKKTIDVVIALTAAFGGLGTMVEFAAWAIGIFLGANVLAGIGMIVQGLFGIVMGFKAVTAAALLAKLAIYGEFILIGAAIVGLLLIIEDLYSFMKGNQSMFEQLLVGGVEKTVKSVFNLIVMIDRAITKLQELYVWVKRNSSISGIMASIVGATIPGGLKALSMTPETSPIPSAGGKTEINMSAPITINVPEGTPPEMVGDRVYDGIKEVLDTMFREISRATRPQEEF